MSTASGEMRSVILVARFVDLTIRQPDGKCSVEVLVAKNRTRLFESPEIHRVDLGDM